MNPSDQKEDDKTKSAESADTDTDKQVQNSNNPKHGYESRRQRAKRNRKERAAKNKDKDDNDKDQDQEEPIIRPRIPILQYHHDYVVVNKPAQMSVHPSANSVRQNQFVVVALLKRQLARKVWPVHRLDHRTSGCLLFAFSSKVCGQLHASLRAHGNNDNDNDDNDNPEDRVDAAANKEYIALLRGDWRNLDETIVVDIPTVDEGIAKEAQTEFQWLASIEATSTATTSENNGEYQGACSLVKCRLLTGRKHQIRRHAFAIGHPILGDSQHGNSKVNRWWRQNRDMDRLFLHCLSLDLPPINYKNDDKDNDATASSAQRIQCVAPLPPELAQVLRREDMKALWDVAVEKEPRLALEPYDDHGGSLGRGSSPQRKEPSIEEQLQETSPDGSS